MKKYSLKERFEYWLEQETSKSIFGLVKFIVFIVLASSLIISILIVVFNFADNVKWIRVFWDTITSSINAEIPKFIDYEETGYVLLIALSAILGLFITSSLISILSSFLDEKLNKIKLGSSLVLEKDHHIILGYTPGEHTLIKELIVGADGKKRTIVIAGNFDIDRTKEEIMNTIEYGKNIKLVFRNIDICNDSELKCLSIDTCKNIVVSPVDDITVINCLFALSSILNKTNRTDITVVAAIRDKKYRLPSGFNNTKNLVLLVLNDFVTKIIANTCTQPGLSLGYVELFNNQGSELYAINCKEATNKSFKELLCQMNYAVPVGLISNGETILNPDVNYIVKENDKLIVFAENREKVHISFDAEVYEYIPKIIDAKKESLNILVIGNKNSYSEMIKEIQNYDCNTRLLCYSDEDEIELNELIKDCHNVSILNIPDAQNNIYAIKDILKDFNRIVLLSDRNLSREASDVDVMVKYENLKYLKNTLNLDFKFCLELRIDNNRRLIKGKNNDKDIIVRANMFSMFLSQLVNNPELKNTYKELLYKGNNDILLLPKYLFDINEKNTISEIRMIIKDYGYIFLGYFRVKGKRFQCHYNSCIDDVIELNDNDVLLVIGKSI